MLITINRKSAFFRICPSFSISEQKKICKSNFVPTDIFILQPSKFRSKRVRFLEVNFEEGLIAPFLTLFYIAFDQKRWQCISLLFSSMGNGNIFDQFKEPSLEKLPQLKSSVSNYSKNYKMLMAKLDFLTFSWKLERPMGTQLPGYPGNRIGITRVI